MAKIDKNDLAPSDAKVFSLANALIEVPCDTTDREVIANALAHPWLDVQVPEADAIDPTYYDAQIKPEDDALSALNDKSNDPDAVKADLPSREDSAPVAIEAGLDQGDKIETDSGVALTVEAAEDSGDAPAPKRKRSASNDSEKE